MARAKALLSSNSATLGFNSLRPCTKELRQRDGLVFIEFMLLEKGK